MKKTGLLCLVLVCIVFESCQKNQNQKDTGSPQVKIEKPTSVECYKSLYEKDTIELKINTLKNGDITGNMVMKIIDNPEKVEKISGKSHGDTLFFDYTFIQGTNDRATFKNPMAMLKKEGGLVLGSGKIETYLGRSYFAKGTPIDFERVKYKFTKVECKD